MPEAFPKPVLSRPFAVRVGEEVQRLRDWRDDEPGRSIPARADGRLIVGSWNIANLGGQEHERPHYRLIAEIVSWFDICAIQEVKDDLTGLRAVVEVLRDDHGGDWRAVFCDKAGNEERAAYVFYADGLELSELVGEISIPAQEQRHIRLAGIDQASDGFDRHPYLATFRRPGGRENFAFVNVHLYYGSQDNEAERQTSMSRRQLEAFAVSRWCDLRSDDPDAYTRLICALGDFNMPRLAANDPVHQALTARGLRVPEHSTRIASAISSDSDYDQLAFMPGVTADRYRSRGVFDYDGAVFPELYADGDREDEWTAYLRYYMSDHRPIWARFEF